VVVADCVPESVTVMPVVPVDTSPQQALPMRPEMVKREEAQLRTTLPKSPSQPSTAML
jgi:hypothetical protein